MSKQRQSRASVVKVKGVSFNYVQFLWNSIGMIKQAQAKKAYSDAMRLVLDLINYLPDSIKDEFKEASIMIHDTMTLIQSNALPCLQKVPDFYIRGIFRNRILQTYASQALASFIDGLSNKLQSLGYMENVDRVEEGEDDWYREHGRRERAKAKEKEEQKRTKEAEKFTHVEGID